VRTGPAIGILAVVMLLLSGSAMGAERFPPPEFESGHVLPQNVWPAPRALWQETLDVGVLIVALSLAAWIALVRRSRRAMVVLVICSLGYFGFYRGGCVCSVGAIQNVAQAVADPACALPFTVALFFALPLLFAVVFGRVFCAGVCPLGAIQDVVLIKPIRVPTWLQQALSLLPFVYLGAAVLFAATDTMFVICRFDPFVGFFRRSGPFHMLVAGGVVLLVSTFVGRPYCRFLCPYGALLGIGSRWAWRHVRTTPDECLVCSLCEDACPFGAIRPPTPEDLSEDSLPRARGMTKTALALLVALPLVGAGTGRLAGPFLATANDTVQLAARISLEENGGLTERTLESEAFRAAGRPHSQLFAEARQMEGRFGLGGALLGAWCGLVISFKVFSLSRIRRQEEYEIDRATCVSCARCFLSCPRERLRLKALGGG